MSNGAQVYGDPSWTQWYGPRTGRPQGSQPRGGALGPKVLEPIKLADVRTTGTLTTATVAARIINPSRKLTCTFGIAFRPSSGKAIATFSASSVWRPQGFDPGTNSLVHYLLDSDEALPALYEMESALRGAIVRATLGIPKDATPATIEGTWFLLATWEPSMPLCDEEAQELYGYASASVDQAATGVLGP